MSFLLLTGCVGAVRPASEVVLQQLVCPCGTGSSHQPHCGLMKKHLQETKKTKNKMLMLEQKKADAISTHIQYTSKDTYTHKTYSTLSGAFHATAL